MPASFKGFAILGCLLIGMGVVGCGRGDGRQSVLGSVQVDGNPVYAGSINFRPEGHAANGSGATIREGRFQLPADKGLLPGTYRVQVLAYRETGRILDDPQRGPMPELVPLEFSNADDLKAVVQSGAGNEFHFELITATK